MPEEFDRLWSGKRSSIRYSSGVCRRRAGRSTARNSLLISTHKFQNITFAENFAVSGHNEGSAVTVGSGVPLNTLYQVAKGQGKILVGALAATVVAAGGYIQGGGHSALSPFLGLAADNVLEFEIVTANLTYLKLHRLSDNFNLATSILGITRKRCRIMGCRRVSHIPYIPTFNATMSLVSMVANDTAAIGSIMAAHAKHIFDWDDLHMSQYVSAYKNTTADAYMLTFGSCFPRISLDEASAALKPFLADAEEFGQILGQQFSKTNINDGLTEVDDVVGSNIVLGPRLIPASVYRDHPDTFGRVYIQLFDAGATVKLCGERRVLGLLVAGGRNRKISENAYIDSAIHPAWQTAKTHIILTNSWDDSTSLSNISAIQNTFKDSQLPILEQIAGSPGAAYCNEADSLEEDFKTMFFGPNYPRLENIKKRYDPMDMFIVAAGVGSDRWDKDGLCRVD
ncbi:hypothetical protein F5146DRAFT_1124186 [Armillaria mellea]|nr:hypothetical protein F5146DRAFT_1124186 [Armillaria mellea]